MMEELTVVDENDYVIGKNVISYIKKHSLIYRQIVIFIIKDNTILLQTRADNGKIDSSVAGHVRYGEEYVATALREMKEELGIDITKNDLMRITKMRVRTQQQENISDRFITLYTYTQKQSDTFVTNEEVGAIHYHTINDIPSLLHHPLMTRGCKQLLQEWSKFLNRQP